MNAGNGNVRLSNFVKDIRGKKFGRLLVVEYAGVDRKYNSLWTVLCDCGKTKIVRGAGIRRGSTVSCGCYHDQRASEGNRTHGMTKKPEYLAWRNMVSRCTKPSNISYENYGGRGITVLIYLTHAHPLLV